MIKITKTAPNQLDLLIVYLGSTSLVAAGLSEVACCGPYVKEFASRFKSVLSGVLIARQRSLVSLV